MKNSKAPDTASEIDFFFFGSKKNWDWAAEIQLDFGQKERFISTEKLLWG